MTAAVVPFRKTGSGPGPRSRASGRVECELHPADQAYGVPTAVLARALHEAHLAIAEAWRLRAESRAIQRGYEERQRKIEVLLAGIEGEGG